MQTYITVDICTKGRYFTTLPMTLMSIAMQSLIPSEIIIYDDNSPTERKDLREIQEYQYIFQIFDTKKIKWSVIFGEGKGQHYGHQRIQQMVTKDSFIYRIDDDCIAEPDVLEKLYTQMKDDVGAVGGSCIIPPLFDMPTNASNNINEIYQPNKQWFKIKETEMVEHLTCSFLYRAGINDFNLSLSKVAHREETMFTYGLKQKGYKILVTPCITWHLRNQSGGIRTTNNVADYDHDEQIFQNWLKFIGSEQKLIILDCGLGDTFIFLKLLPELKVKYPKLTLAVCYPEVFEDDGVNLISIAEAKQYENEDKHNIYMYMDSLNWKDSIENAYRQLYL